MRLIDADALKKKHCDDCTCKSECMGSSCKIYAARCLVEELPTIETEPVKHGTWIDTPVPAENTFVAKCSVCGFWQKTNGEDKTGKHLIHKAVYRYCAGCGARMDAEDINVLTSDGGAENG